MNNVNYDPCILYTDAKRHSALKRISDFLWAYFQSKILDNFMCIIIIIAYWNNTENVILTLLIKYLIWIERFFDQSNIALTMWLYNIKQCAALIISRWHEWPVNLSWLLGTLVEFTYSQNTSLYSNSRFFLTDSHQVQISTSNINTDFNISGRYFPNVKIPSVQRLRTHSHSVG